ncbi:MAG: hypothetical protein KDC38_21810, partial [Planctomycetes bacterium]|nr:hypothetical protein [Planctomycetota bacterium]
MDRQLERSTRWVALQALVAGLFVTLPVRAQVVDLFCTIDVDVAAPTMSEISIAWSLGSAYDTIEISIDGSPSATLPGTATAA